MKLQYFEVPSDIYFKLEPFTVKNGTLTPTFKLRRNVAKEVYSKEIEKMYESKL